MADGYGNSRIVKFDRSGNFIRAWGSYGSGVGEFILPHSVVVDKAGRVYVADRENARIQIFDSDGRFLTQWTGIGDPESQKPLCGNGGNDTDAGIDVN